VERNIYQNESEKGPKQRRWEEMRRRDMETQGPQKEKTVGRGMREKKILVKKRDQERIAPAGGLKN